eukprot:Opistho-1_new@56964
METVTQLSIVETILPMTVIVFIIAIGVVLLNQHFHKNLFEQKLKQESLKILYRNELLRSSILIQEEERKRIAQDLHDELGAVLSIMRMHLIVLEKQITNDNTNMLAGVENVRQLSESALSSIRSISHQLMPPQLEKFGLIKTLESVTNQINKTGKIQIHLTTSCDDTPILTWAISLGYYRIIMELINNTIKHANATAIDLNILCNTFDIKCTYSDNGCGINTENSSAGLGLKSIEGRVTALNGTLKWGNNEKENGFYAFIEIPIDNTTLNNP